MKYLEIKLQHTQWGWALQITHQKYRQSNFSCDGNTFHASNGFRLVSAGGVQIAPQKIHDYNKCDVLFVRGSVRTHDDERQILLYNKDGMSKREVDSYIERMLKAIKKYNRKRGRC